MKCIIFLMLYLETTVFCAMVRELPDLFNVSDIVENATDIEEVTAVTALFSEVFDQLIHLEDEPNQTQPEQKQNWSDDDTPILSALRNFWAQARTGLLDPIDPVAKEVKNEHVIKALEHGLIEATTMLVNRMEETTFASLPPKEQTDAPTESPAFSKRQGEEVKPSEAITNPGIVTKRQTAFDLMANMSSSCTNCYERLQVCVQQCFVEHNCNDVQRSVRTCPPVPNRLCSFFTQWSPVDECANHSDCKSPLLCCNDGCGQKCVSGVWHS